MSKLGFPNPYTDGTLIPADSLRANQLTPDVLTVHPPGTPASEMGMARFGEWVEVPAGKTIREFISPPYIQLGDVIHPAPTDDHLAHPLTPHGEIKVELATIRQALTELTAMTCARLDRLEAADRANRFGYNGGL